MRLLKTSGSNNTHWTPQLCDFRGEKYTILSHRWLQNAREEILFEDIAIIDDGGSEGGRRKSNYVRNTRYCGSAPFNKVGYTKLWTAARWASSNGIEYIWADTCCLDTTNSAEVSECLNSLWAWYSASTGCYAYLHDVPNDLCNSRQFSEDSLRHAEWWHRGFTLQELIAPREVVFFNKDWQLISYKSTPRMAHIISAITRIETEVLWHQKSVQDVSIARRMNWASQRRTSRIEDTAYCLLGIFQVNMSINYGEGERAFQRLQQKILKSSDDESIFAWLYEAAQEEQTSGLLARHPSAFVASYKYSSLSDEQNTEQQEPYAMTNKGLAIYLDPRPHASGTFIAALRCPAPNYENCFLAVYLQRIGNSSTQFLRVRCDRLTAVNKRGVGRKVYIKQVGPASNFATVENVRVQMEQQSLQPSAAVRSMMAREQASDLRSISEISQLDAPDGNISTRNSTGIERSTGRNSESRPRQSVAMTDLPSIESNARRSFWRRHPEARN